MENLEGIDCIWFSILQCLRLSVVSVEFREGQTGCTEMTNYSMKEVKPVSGSDLNKSLYVKYGRFCAGLLFGQ